MTVTAAGLGGLAYWVTIYPLDQIKSAMSTDSIIVSERKYPTMAVTAQVCTASALHAVLSHGLRGLTFICAAQLLCLVQQASGKMSWSDEMSYLLTH